MSHVADIEQRAAEWLMRSEQPEWSTADQLQLDAWLASSTAHLAAYWRLQHGWREADRIASLGERVEPSIDDHGPLRQWSRVARAMAACVALMVGGIVAHRSADRSSARPARFYSTAIGGRRTVPLDDGSRIELNTSSTLHAAVSRVSRDVWLDRGEAYFEVAHLNGRPFIVHAGSRTVTVLGTKFSVRRDGDKVTVSVIEGRVRVEDAVQPDAVPAAIITAGDIAVAQGPATLLAAKSEEHVASTLAWRAGLLDFDRTSLSDAAAEFNRYNLRKIVIGDPQTGSLQIGGAFRAANVEGFVRLLHDAYGIHVEEQPGQIKISS